MTESRSAPPFRHLDDEMIDRLQVALVDALRATRDYLEGFLAGIDPAFASSLPTDRGTLSLRTCLHKLNSCRSLSTGEVPFRIWLKNVLATSGNEPFGLLVQEALDQLAAASPTDPLPPYLRQVCRVHERLAPYFEVGSDQELLEQVYVHLALQPDAATATGLWHDGRAGGQTSRGTEEAGPGKDRLTLRAVLGLELEDGAPHRWVVRGEPGAGKTTLLRHLAYTLAKEGLEAGSAPTAEQPWVPVFESLPRFAQGETLLQRMVGILCSQGLPASALEPRLAQVHEDGNLLILLDGLDEVPEERRTEIEARIGHLHQTSPRARIVVATRAIPYRRPHPAFRELEVRPLDRQQQIELLSRRLPHDDGTPDLARAEAELPRLHEELDLETLAANPLYLTLIAFLIAQGEDLEPRRALLFGQIFQLLYKGKHRRAERAREMPRPRATHRALRFLAWQLTEAGIEAEAKEDLEERLVDEDPLRVALSKTKRWDDHLGRFLDDVAECTGILGEYDGPERGWRYWHRTFREAYVAEQLDRVREAGGQEAILEQARNVRGKEAHWAEPLALFTGRLRERRQADELVRTLVRENQPLGLRALATAQGVSEGLLDEVLKLTEGRDQWQERAKLYRRIPELLDDAEASIQLINRLRKRTLDGNDLYFLDVALLGVARKWPTAEGQATALRDRLTGHIPKAEGKLFWEVDSPLDGNRPLWCEVQAGTYRVGSPETEQGQELERPQHEVSLRSPIWVAAVPVTNAQYAAFDPGLPFEPWKAVPESELEFHPTIRITWFAANMFCRWLQATFPGARLPLEEEWEIACRANQPHRYWSGDTEQDLNRVGWYRKNSKARTHRVAEKPANPWGLYDVHGNVWEWALNPYDSERDQGRDQALPAIEPTLVTQKAESDPANGVPRVLRGGSCWGVADGARAAYRGGNHPGRGWRVRGFRVVLPFAPERP